MTGATHGEAINDHVAAGRPLALIVVQARMNSSRLFGKVLLDIMGRPMLARQLERIALIRTPARVVVATTCNREDDRIAGLCSTLGVECFRGHPTDLLDRHYQAACAYAAQVVAKIPADCPLIDPAIIDSVFDGFYATGCDYASNLHPPSFPDGNDVEVMRVKVLESAWRNAEMPMEREHTTPYLWERPLLFKLCNVRCEQNGIDCDYSMRYRWTVDYRDDYELVRAIFTCLHPRKPAFSYTDIIQLLADTPALTLLNRHYLGVNWYRNHLHELKTVPAHWTRQSR